MFQLSDCDGDKDSRKNENIKYSEVNNVTEMINKRSKSLEREILIDTMGPSINNSIKRPDTAPPILSFLKSIKIENLINEQKNIDHSLYYLRQNENMEKCIKNERSDITNHTDFSGSWHEHIYKKPSKTPTPYSIMDILHWGSTKNINCKHTSDINKNSNQPYQKVEPTTLKHLLNLSKTSLSDENSINNENYTREFSESSEDESILNDQPLNLCTNLNFGEHSSDACKIKKNFKKKGD
jgi:hypothetical protein